LRGFELPPDSQFELSFRDRDKEGEAISDTAISFNNIRNLCQLNEEQMAKVSTFISKEWDRVCA
jgi:hypothetical protein